MDEKTEQLFADFEKATKDLHNEGAKTSQKPSHRYEVLYGLAYRRLVNAGLKPKLRVKHRPLY